MRLLAVSLATLTLTVVACVGDSPEAASPGSSSSSGEGGGPSSSSSGAPGASSSGGSSSGDAGTSSGGPVATCGVPGKPCCDGTTCNGGAACTANLCSCPVGTTTCGETCVDLTQDEANCGRCDRNCGTGTCNAGACTAVTIVPGQRSVTALVAHGDRYFWSRSVSGVTGGGLYSAHHDGSDLTTLHDGDVTSACYSLTVFHDTAYALCKDPAPAGLRILTCTLPACTDITYRAAPAGSGVTADPDSGRLFYATVANYNQVPNGRVFELGGDGSSTAVGNANQANPGLPAVSGGFVYWLNSGTYSSDAPQANGGVYRAALGTLATQSTVADVNGLYYDMGALSTDGTNVYFIGRSKFGNRTNVLFAPITAGSATVFADDQASNDVVSDGTNVYFNNDVAKEIRTCPRVAGCNGAPTTLTTNEDGVGLVTTDDDGVLWTKQSGEIRRIAKP